MDGPVTLAIDIGGTGLKADALDANGHMLVDRVRTPTEYPCPPDALISALRGLVAPLPAFDRVSAGFPGVVRNGLVLSAPHFVTVDGPGSHIDPELVKAWDHFDLASALKRTWQRPTRVLNDADLQGLDVVSGRGVELVVTLGTGVGTAIFEDGRLGSHLELAHHPFRKGEAYNDQLGAAARKHIGNKRWKTIVSARRSIHCARSRCSITSTSAEATPSTPISRSQTTSPSLTPTPASSAV